MPRPYYGSTDAEVKTWAANAAAKLVAGFASFGVTLAQANALLAASDSFAEALDAAQDPATRGASTIQTKNTRRDVLTTLIRQTVRQIQAFPSLTDTQRVDLGITVPKAGTPIPVPEFVPTVHVEQVLNRVLGCRAHSGSVASRKRPAGTQGVSFFAHVGEEPPADLTAWVWKGNTTNQKAEIEFDAALPPGTKVWVVASYYNFRGENGPLGVPVSAYLGGGVSSQTA